MTTPTKKPTSRKAYNDLVKRVEKRFAPELPWEQLPLQRAGRRGRPQKDAPHLVLKPRTVKMPEQTWQALAAAAAQEGVSVNAMLTAMNNDLLRRNRLSGEIRRLVRRGLLHSRKRQHA